MLDSLKHWYQKLAVAKLPDTCVCLDTETSGLDPACAQLLSIGAVRIEHGVILGEDKFHVVVKPDQAYPLDSVPIHRLRPRDVEQGIPVQAALDALCLFIRHDPIVGYHIHFDRALLERALGRPFDNRFLDVADIYHKRAHQKLAGNMAAGHVDLSFEVICQQLDIPVIQRHTALGDALTTALMYLKLR
ncbi:exonuclease domain-containing protein [Litoribacillus peritrichatus]|uniref:3'-5' exonuclease n=1 Tax=Litoribacillus peritrichatus TaxID=718191 RepID=A0ABP7MX17_9GAMM